MPWTCEETEGRLLDAMDGTLAAAQQAEMDGHLAGCAKCARLLQGVRQTVQVLQKLEPVEPGPWLEAKIISRTTPDQPKPQRVPAWLEFSAHPRLLLGALAVLITFSVAFSVLGGAGRVSQSRANPVVVFRQVDRAVHLAYARGVKFLSDLRVVYEIQSQFQRPVGDPSASPGKKTLHDLEQRFGPLPKGRLAIARNLRSWRRA